ncbi:MAG: GreA/GreB family elongation factor [Candidatus Shapirobacteria bacterium]
MITKQGKLQLEKDLQALRDELRRTVEERSKAAAEGDLKENSAYIFLGERAEVLRSQISEAEADLKKAVVQPISSDTNTVCFGHSVSLRFESDGRNMTIALVGKNDARLKPGWISVESPLGLAIIGKKKGDEVMVNGQLVTIFGISAGNI